MSVNQGDLRCSQSRVGGDMEQTILDTEMGAMVEVRQAG